MIYTELTRKAAMIAYRAHDGQSDKNGWPYIFHPVHVAEQMTTEDSCVVALLHDVVEDTDITIEDLRKEGFTEDQLRAVELMTHEEGISYMDYIRRLKPNPLARAVKLADLAHNMDKTRRAKDSGNMEERMQKYSKAREYLLEE